ncbi:MAG: type III-B CRISPR module RAMP protein Cmr6 [Ktedonobacteraceae bacterium]
MTYYLPGATAQLVEKQVRMCRNLGLLLDKYPPREAIQESKRKSEWLKEIASQDHIDGDLAKSAYDRWFEMIKKMEAQYFTSVLDWRMVIGLGGETVLETDLTLHHLYGIPFIPGSALKGLARAYAAGEDEEFYIQDNNAAGRPAPSQDTETDHERIQQIFGSQKHAGTVLFFDAMPLDGKVKFALDIMNAHYPNYYSEKKPPTNDQSPNPVTFLTVTDTRFTFALAPRRPENKADVEQAKKWLQKALQKYGVGGKTSAGYGRFTITPDGKAAPQLQAEQEQKLEGLSPAQPEKRPEAIARIRPNIPLPTKDQIIQGVVIAPTETLRQKAFLEGANTFLRYKSYETRDILIAISSEYSDAQNWKVGDTRNCQVMRVEELNDCVVLICKPVQSKFGDKKKR